MLDRTKHDDLNNHETSPLMTGATHNGASSSARRTSQRLRPRQPQQFLISRRVLQGIFAMMTAVVLLVLCCAGNQKTRSQTSDNYEYIVTSHDDDNNNDDDGTSSDRSSPLIHPQVPKDIPGFPSFRSYASTPYQVSYDRRSIQLNGQSTLFLGGSMHPIRATRATWGSALDMAVVQGLNLITIYVMWTDHQKFPDSPFDWSLLPGTSWSLAESIQAAAQRGFFIHIRVGPYVCAEYSYGGIPEWVAMTTNRSSSMAMRRANLPWMAAMTDYLRHIIRYLQDNKLFAYQGGPIILAQIENELGEDNLTPERKDLWAFMDRQGRFSDQATMFDGQQRATLQDYADWCGKIAHELAPNVIWTMCNGLSANTTIETYNGFLDTTSWLDSHGDNGRIQLDQPALWTEDEGGFQIWGDTPEHPSDYTWGVSARSMAFTALRWFARGGTHLNFYMWWGGYNRGRSAAGGIANMYALESPLCPSGEPREPKFSYLQSLISSIVRAAPVLLQASSALDRPEKPDVRQEDGSWMTTNHTLAFRYQWDDQEVIFVENTSDAAQEVRIHVSGNATSVVFSLDSYSAILVVDGKIVFDSAFRNLVPMHRERLITVIPDALRHRHSWSEVLCISDTSSKHALNATLPVEQTELNMKKRVWSDYARYHVSFLVEEDVANDDTFLLQIESVQAMAFTVHMDGIHVGSVDTHKHVVESPVVYSVTVPASLLQRGDHNLVIVSESLGYSNLVGRWGSGTTAKTKGLTGNIVIVRNSLDNHNATTLANLTDGTSLWSSLPGLSFDPGVSHRNHRLLKPWACQQNANNDREESSSSFAVGIGQWTEYQFPTPRYNESLEKLYIDIRQGRGHFWLNGHDLGRYWNITEDTNDGDDDDDDDATTTTSLLFQSYYHLPHDLLLTPLPSGGGSTDDNNNRLVVFDGLNFGACHDNDNNEPIVTTVRLVTSHVGPASNDDDASSIFPDQVGFDLACLRR